MVKQYIERILSLQRQRDYAGAYEVLRDALIYYPSSEFLQTDEVYLLLRLKRLRDARQKAEERFETLKKNPFFLRTYIEIISKERDREHLLRIAEWLRSMPLRDEDLYISLSGALVRLGEKETAKELLNSGLAFMPEAKEIISHLKRLEEGSEEDGINYYRGRFKGVEPQKAIEEIETILFLPEYEGNVSIRLYLAELYKKKGDLKRASEVYSDCLRIKDSLYVRKMLGFVYYRLGEMDRAFLYLKDAFVEDPEDHALYNTISKIIEKTGNTVEAEALVNEVMSRHPGVKKIYGLSKRLKKNLMRSEDENGSLSKY